jgi:hypothetical protein
MQATTPLAIPEYRKLRTQLIRAIRKLVKPHFWESGYAGKNKKGLMLWVPKDTRGTPTYQTFKLNRNFVLTEFQGFSEEGVITDSFAGGLACTAYESLPLEDLYRLQAWAERRFGKSSAVKA